MLISIECRFGPMFISLASGRRLCFNCILFVALILVLSGSMNTFLNGRRLPPLPWAEPYVDLGGRQTSMLWSHLLPLLLPALGLQGLHPWTMTVSRWLADIVFALAIFPWSNAGDSARFSVQRFCYPMQPFGPWWTSCSPKFLCLLPLSSPWCLSQCRGQQGRFNTCQGQWSRSWGLSLDPTASHTPQPCSNFWEVVILIAIFSSRCRLLSGWLHCQSWCIATLAALKHFCPCHTAEVPSLLPVHQDTWCTPSAFPCVVQWSVLDVPRSLLLQGLHLHMRLGWMLGLQWQCGTSPVVWRMQGTRIIPPWQNVWTSVCWRLYQVHSWGCQWIWKLWYPWSLLWHLFGWQVFCTPHSWTILMTSLLLHLWKCRIFAVKIVKLS